ncbi:MAG: PIN/TRAM domain-containing protein [bacterium]|jgi:uncharacterized protein YacL
MNEKNKKPAHETPFLGVIRLLFIMLFTFISYKWARSFEPYIQPEDIDIYVFSGFVVAVTLVVIESQIQYAFPQELMVGLFGLLCGLSASALIQIGLPSSATTDLTKVMLHLFLGYFGMTIALRYAHRFDFSATKFLLRSEDRFYGAKFLDTSILIDGRIVDIIEARFVEGLVVIPSFVINELQMLADSEDHNKRMRGRRGLDISKQLQNMTKVNVELLTEDFPNIHGVDRKLLALCKRYEGTLLTIDYNLNKVAEIDEVPVMNINQLAQSLRTVVLPGEEIRVQIIREGKEQNQGVAYLPDGTMVVVENGRKVLGSTVPVIVGSELQTSAGKIVFARLAGPEDQQKLPEGNEKRELTKTNK